MSSKTDKQKFQSVSSGFCLIIRRNDGSRFLANGVNYTAIYRTRREAQDFANELGEHINRRRIKVIPVTVTIEAEP